MAGAGKRAPPAPLAYAPQPGPQTYLLACPIPEVLFGGARGGGKTHGLLGDFAQHAREHGQHARGILFRRTYDELDEVKAQAETIYPKIGAFYKTGRNTWHFRNGATLKLRYLRRDEDASHYQGHQYTWMGIDEAGNFPDPDPINKLRATLRSVAGVPTSLRLTANPGGPGHGWIKERFIDPAPPLRPIYDEATGEARVYIPSRLEDNPLLNANDPTYVNRIKQSGPSWLVQAWLAGDWNATPEGGLIKSEWFQRYQEVPAHLSRVVQSWDTAYKPEQHNDPTVCTTWAETRTGYYLLDVWRKRVAYPELKRAARSLAEKWNPAAVLIEDKGSGTSLIQELRSDTNLPVIPCDPKGQNKIDRLVAVSSLFEAGLVHLPYHASWLLDYEIELTIFPLAAHDDQVDSTSQFLAWAHRYGARVSHYTTGATRTGFRAEVDGPPDRDDPHSISIPSHNDFGGFL